MAAKYDWDIEVIDVNNAFLNGAIPEHREIYLQMPTGFSNTVCKLQKALYGLKQSVLIWYLTLRDALEDLGLKAAKPYEHKSRRTCLCDGIRRRHQSHCTQYKTFKRLTEQKFPSKEHNLGLDIQRDRKYRTIHVSQTSYTASIIEEFGHLAADSNVPISHSVGESHSLMARQSYGNPNSNVTEPHIRLLGCCDGLSILCYHRLLRVFVVVQRAHRAFHSLHRHLRSTSRELSFSIFNFPIDSITNKQWSPQGPVIPNTSRHMKQRRRQYLSRISLRRPLPPFPTPFHFSHPSLWTTQLLSQQPTRAY